MNTRRIVSIGGWSLIVGAVAFATVFSYRAVNFDYRDILHVAARDVLPRLRDSGEPMRAVWAIYAALPFLFIPGGVGAYLAVRRADEGIMLMALICAFLVAVTMPLGLMRWPSVNWVLAKAYEGAEIQSQDAIAAVFSGLNLYLGTYIGEFVGEVAMAGFFLLTGVAARSATEISRWFVWGNIVCGVTFLVGAWRNLIGAVAVVAELNNWLIPIWMIAFGVALIRMNLSRSELG